MALPRLNDGFFALIAAATTLYLAKASKRSLENTSRAPPGLGEHHCEATYSRNMYRANELVALELF